MANQYSDKDQDMNRQDQNQKNPGNFKNDPQRASEEGRKGGESSQGRRSE